MGRLVNQVEALSRDYVRKGGKKNRRQQAARMVKFAQFCEDLGARSLGQIGRRHVVRYWKRIQHLSDSTRYHHYRALVHLWRLAGLLGVPPEPFPVGQGVSSPEGGSQPRRGSASSGNGDHG